MHDTIPERGSADLAGLALVNRERAVVTGTVGLAGKFLVQQEQLAFEIEDEAGNAGLESFATGGGMSRKKQAPERDHPVPEVALTLHGFSSLRLRSQPPTSRPISSMDLAAKA